MPTEKLFLRIIAGTFGGRRLDSPPAKTMTTRPMLDRVKEALFDILARRVEGMRILDLCSGTGSLGLEALSRGARHVTFVEADPRNVRLIQDNIEKLGVAERSLLVKGELPGALRRLKGPFDLAFFDPPYQSSLAGTVLPRLGSKSFLVPNAIVLVHRDRRSAPLKFSKFAVDRRHRIGDCELWFLRFSASAGREKGEDE
jgi:16S rRNA (guanine966-N2)-methyltransferase